MKKDKFCIDLKVAHSINKEDYYLSIISGLIDELNKYEEVEVCHNEALTNWKEKMKLERETDLYMTIAQKAKLEGRTLQSIIDEYGCEALGFSEDTHRRIGMN